MHLRSVYFPRHDSDVPLILFLLYSPRPSNVREVEAETMSDILFVLLMLALFAVGLGYVAACERL